MRESSEPFESHMPFNKSFSSEGLLQQAIAGLLTRMPDVSGVQILQGALELGKDIVFYIRGGFGEQVLCACVVKNSKISGEVSHARGARTVYLQAQQAFDSPHTDGTGKDVYVERVYVVTPFDLSPATIKSISGRLKDRPGQVLFIGGAILFDLFKQYWPDFFADESNAIEHYLADIHQRFDDEHPLSGLVLQYRLGSIDAHSKRIYVPQMFHRDISSYTEGHILQSSFPNETELPEEWSNDDLRKTKNDFRSFSRALTFLHEWGYYPGDRDPHGKEGVEVAMSDFISALEKEWKESVRLQYGSHRPDIPRIDSSVGVLLTKTATLKHLLKTLETQRDEALSILRSALDLLSEFVTSRRISGIRMLSSATYLSSCILDDCARSTPDGLFDETKRATVSFPKTLLDQWSGHLLIVGAPGFGKTSFCRWNALEDAAAFSSGRSDIVPVYVPLYRLSKKELTSFEDTFLASLGVSALLPDSGKKHTSTKGKRVRLYLDGLDEIASVERRREVVELARKGTKTSEGYQVIITARDSVYGPWLRWLPRISLSGFDDEEMINLVSKWLGKDPEDAERFYKQLGATPMIKSLMQTPLLATLVILVFRQTGKIPESKTKLYEIFIDLLSGGWDTAKGILRETKFGQRIKLMILTSLASRLHEKGQRDCTDKEIKSAIQMHSKSLVNDFEGLRNELTEDGLINRSGAVVQFSHLSLQEFLTAKDFISDPQPKRVRRAVEAFLSGDDWWREVLRFYVGLSGKPREITLWLLSEIDRYSSSPQNRVDELLGAVVESFPEFSIEDLLPSSAKPSR